LKKKSDKNNIHRKKGEEKNVNDIKIFIEKKKALSTPSPPKNK
jgi:hypothetical protein